MYTVQLIAGVSWRKRVAKLDIFSGNAKLTGHFLPTRELSSAYTAKTQSETRHYWWQQGVREIMDIVVNFEKVLILGSPASCSQVKKNLSKISWMCTFTIFIKLNSMLTGRCWPAASHRVKSRNHYYRSVPYGSYIFFYYIQHDTVSDLSRKHFTFC